MAEPVLVEQQVALHQAGKLISDDGTVDCEVVTLSRNGAQVRLDAALGQNEDLFLAIAGFGQLSCRVMDADGDHADLRFQGDPETQESIFQDILTRIGDDEGRRFYLRRSVLWPGTLKTKTGQVACTILNMSLGGAKVALSQEQECAGRATLFGDRFDGLAGSIMWQRGRMVGVQFESEPTEVARVLGDLLPAITSSS
ncbi:MAG: PilZ domain-containing protein [Kiloniellaceae bacterium]